MSKFGVEKFAQADLEALYIPHAFHPAYEPKDRAEAREALRIPEDAFVVGTNLTNKSSGMVHRKAYGQVFEGFTYFAQSHPDAILYVHAEASGYQAQVGWDLKALAETYGIRDRIRFADQHSFRMGIPIEAMPWLYSAFDVLLHSTMGEGFGVPIIEAQACGTPVVVTDFTSMPELVGDGWKVGGIHWYSDRTRSFWMVPDPVQIAEALGEAYKRGGARSDKAVEFAQAYTADRVFEDHMLPVFENLRERIDPLPAGLAA
jgi:glycosyltransferase involved in cell wall biosynthesis